MEFKYGARDLLHADELIAVGDIHGEDKKLEDILNQVTPLLDKNPNCHLVFCGDYCDRGPNSARVFELLIETKAKYPNQSFFIMGNHEEMFITTLQGESWWHQYTMITWDSMASHWGLTLFSVQELVQACIEHGVVDFLDSLIPYYENDNYICTHAPLDRANVSWSLSKYTAEFGKSETQEYFLEKYLRDIRWGFTMEDPKLCRIKDMQKYHICGHQFQHHKQPRLFKHRAFIDVGCGARKDKPLVAVKFPGNQVFRSFC